MLVDLHVHSALSDGTDQPEALVAAAGRAGLSVLALADHDTTAGWARAERAATSAGVRLVPAIEVSTTWRGADVHLLALWPDGQDAALQQLLATVRASRDERVPRILARLREHGVMLSTSEVAQAAGGTQSVGRPHVADALVAAGVVADRDQAFHTWLGEGRPAHVAKAAPDLPDAVRVVRAAGAVPVLAHPWGRGSRAVLDPAALAELAAAGVVGVEVDHVDHDPGARRVLAGLAGELGLVVTGGSDYHGTGKAGVALGQEVTRPDAFAALEEAHDALRRR